jgi:hypothetical protein
MMSGPNAQSRAERDRIRAAKGLQRKELLRAIRKTVKGWKDGATPDASMQRISDLMDGKVQ